MKPVMNCDPLSEAAHGAGQDAATVATRLSTA